MEPVTSDILHVFLQRLSERYPGAGAFYLLGGSALCLLGNPRVTQDVDYTFELDTGSAEQFQATLTELATEMRLDLEAVPLAEFIPLPPQARERRRRVGRYGQLDVYIFDLYSIALSKIARGFEADLEDVIFMLRQGLSSWESWSATLTLSCLRRPNPTLTLKNFTPISKRFAAGLPDPDRGRI